MGISVWFFRLRAEQEKYWFLRIVICNTLMIYLKIYINFLKVNMKTQPNNKKYRHINKNM